MKSLVSDWILILSLITFIVISCGTHVRMHYSLHVTVGNICGSVLLESREGGLSHWK
jgi:hypothetical protein